MQEHIVSEGNLEQCLKCNICTSVCPMMAVNKNYPGPKKAGPDGERYRLKDPAFFDYALKYCLNCKRCEVACPSGVRVGDIIQTARIRYGSMARPLRDATLASTDLVGSLAVPFAPVVNGVLGLKPVKAAMDAVIGVAKERTFPKYASRTFTSWFRKEAAPAQEAFPRFVSYFHGCYVNYNFPALGRDLVALLNACGYGVHLLEREKCCGVALISNGMDAQARRQAEVNLASMRSAVARGEDIITGSSTCTFTMRDEYGHVLGLETGDVRDHLMLLTRWLAPKVASGAVRLSFRPDFRKKVVYHTACHMQRLGWQEFTLDLLRRVPGLELTVLEQECCGIAGTFGFKKENYAWSQKIGSKLFARIAEATQGDPEAVVVTECETCKWQIEMSAGVQVVNPVSLLAEALDLEATRALNR